jgi:hypothetical protein
VRKTWVLAAACAMVMGLGAVQGNTIQPIIMSVAPGAGTYTYNIDIQITPNTFLKDYTAAPTNYPSSVSILDFGHVSSVQIVANVGDVTSVGDWTKEDPILTSGTALLPNYVTNPAFSGYFILQSDSGMGLIPDNQAYSNVVLMYTGAGVPASDVQRSLVHLQVVTDMAPGNIIYSIDTEGDPFTNTQHTATYALSTYGVPEPETLSVGLLGCVGLLLRRRRA